MITVNQLINNLEDQIRRVREAQRWGIDITTNEFIEQCEEVLNKWEAGVRPANWPSGGREAFFAGYGRSSTADAEGLSSRALKSGKSEHHAAAAKAWSKLGGKKSKDIAGEHLRAARGSKE